ncbi:MAG: glycosyltransferase family 2 protein, partial [Acetobacteraceae bacterium]|nr:glycosyltransferase family 2 protein [Acetobacteraceae bacterium]
MKTVGLSMIVKDEAHVILECLESVRPLVDYALVVDTGSTDRTQQIVRDYLIREKLPGGVVEEPWQNFAYNRTFALHELRKAPNVDYALTIDADDLLELDDGFDPAAFKTELDLDLYDIEVSHGNIIHIRPQLFRNNLPFSFKGVVHEYLEAPPGDLSRGRAKGFRVKISGGGARSRNTRKFEDDAALLERALATETEPFLVSRYTFYLAQSYRDCGEKEKALENYLKRADLGCWDQEIYISLLEAGNLMSALGRPFDEVIATYLRASDLVPSRAEALHAASRYCRDHGRNAEGYEYARRGINLSSPSGALFAQLWIYDYGLLDEYAINAYWARAYRESLDASLRLLASDKAPQSMHAHVAANARFAAEKLPKTATSDHWVPKISLRSTCWHQLDRFALALRERRGCCWRSLPSKKRRPCRSTSTASRRSITRNRRSRCISEPTTIPTGPSRFCATAGTGWTFVCGGRVRCFGCRRSRR